MSALLAIETSTQACSAALLWKGHSYQEISVEPRSHTRLLLPMVDKLLADAGISPAQLDAIAYTAGPGSFTGLRIGFGVVQGLAFGCDLPVIGVSTLQTLALAAQRELSLSAKTQLLTAFDARMGEVYWGLYQLESGSVPEAVIDDCLTAPQQVGQGASDANLVGVGEGWHLAEQFPLSPQHVYEGLFPQAVDVLTLASEGFNNGQAVPVEQAQLTYLRDTVSWKKRQRLRTQ
ncbi:tRNA (adenosine(37)-N6)-threonylcarbamoyltransferase complex dimerization subunit type 1 TsaB [bacterium SCSIO 12696]|nr:tRNA (adenosine(37)-N6)-threonylcarbamoyltransferase complex dimerization subunit type 1 TsaB [bacterium SCSIO 12696]